MKTPYRSPKQQEIDAQIHENSAYRSGYQDANLEAQDDKRASMAIAIGAITGIALALGAFAWYLLSQEDNTTILPVPVPQETPQNEPTSDAAPGNINVTITESPSPSTDSPKPDASDTSDSSNPGVNSSPSVTTNVNVDPPSSQPKPDLSPTASPNTPTPRDESALPVAPPSNAADPNNEESTRQPSPPTQP